MKGLESIWGLMGHEVIHPCGCNGSISGQCKNTSVFFKMYSPKTTHTHKNTPHGLNKASLLFNPATAHSL